jgi:hypothetical protein
MPWAPNIEDLAVLIALHDIYEIYTGQDASHIEESQSAK